MGVIAVLAAAAAAWIFGAVWYGVIGTRWREAQGLDEAALDRGNPVPHVVGFLCCVLVAGMFRHVLAMAGLTTVGASAVAGLGLGLFIVAPWIATNVLYGGKGPALIWMDGGYPVGGMVLMGVVLALFA